MSEVKRFDVPSMRSLIQGEQAVMGYEVVLASDYDALAAKLTMAEDAAEKGDAARQQCGGMEMEIEELRAELAELRARVVVLPDRLPRREDQSESAQEGRRWGMSEVREVFEKRMAGIFDLSAYVDSQGDIRYSDSHTQAAWDGCQLVVDLFEPAPSVRQGMSLDHIGRLHALEKLRLRIAAHMFIRKNGELLGYGVTVPEMREFRELLIPFNGEIK
ncbi:TPA: hypothetical protein SL688_005743 [Pseudomonas aeruginosa]|nr:hypothetical protein [Pseudomonas aeruginosa]HEJ3905516.1 hypothetical protein [Pseudomonas aeruginosa]HEJ5239789.1 hypothetical protein [Pseudomonas aeruginosa]HEJ5323196.1 hypothetical protein [Pseudomonas aeruginosa]